MNEKELIALLAGTREAPIFVCRISPDMAAAIGAIATEVWLSRETVCKQESKHGGASKRLYLRAPHVIANGYVRVQPPHHLIFIHHEKAEKIRSFKAVVKATQAGNELFLASIHRVKKTDVRATYRKTTTLEKWKRRRREVGPPKNPT